MARARPGETAAIRGGARVRGSNCNVSQYTVLCVNNIAYNGAHTTMVASVDRVSHVNGWSFHSDSDLPGLTRDANVDSVQLLPAAR